MDRLRLELNELASLAPKDPDEIPIIRPKRRSKTDELAKKERIKRRQDLHSEIHRLYNAGHTIRAITRQLGKSCNTIYKYPAMKEFPPKFARKRVASILVSYEDHLRRSWKKGCRNASELWRKIREIGYPGTRKQEVQSVYESREKLVTSTPFKYRKANIQEQNNPDSTNKTSLQVARRLVWIFLKSDDNLTPDESQLRNRLSDHKILARALEMGQ